MRVNGLGKGTEIRESVRLANMGNFILDSGQESMVQLLVKGSSTPLDTSSEVVEVDKVLVIILIMITNLQPLNWQAPKQRFEGILNVRGLVQWHGSSRVAAQDILVI